MISKSKIALIQSKKQQSEDNRTENVLDRQQINQMYQQNIFLSSQIQKLTDQNHKLKKEVANLKSIISKHSTAVQNSKQSVIKSQLQSLTKFHNKTKKQLENVTKSYQELIKKNNQYKNKVISSEKEIALLKTVKSTKNFNSQKEIEEIKSNKAKRRDLINNQENTQANNNLITNSKSKNKLKTNISSSKDITNMNSFEQQNIVLQKRLQLYQKERKGIQNVFQPIIQQSNEQIKLLIQQKNKLLLANSQFSKDINMLEIQVNDLKEKNIRLIQILNKNRSQSQQRDKTKIESIANNTDKIKEQYEQRIQQLTSLYHNSQSQIKSLEEVGKYLSAENRKLLMNK